MSIFSYKQRNNIVLVILIVLGCCILYSLRTIAGSLLCTVVMYAIFRPVFLFLTQRWRWKLPVAALAIILGSFAIIVLPFLTLGLMVMNKIADFQKDALLIKVLIRRTDDFLGSKLDQPDLLDHILNKGNIFISELFPSIVTGVFEIILGIIIMYFLLYCMFTKRVEFENGLLKYAPFKEQNALKFATELKNITYSNVLGQGFIAFVQGALVSIGFFIFDIHDAVFWGVIATFLSFLPVLGSPIVFIPAAIIELAGGNTFSGVGILLWGLILIMNIDNVLRWIIAKKIADTHPVITIIGIVIGVPVFGALGVVFGPLLLSYFILTVRIYETSRMASDRLEKIRSSEDKNNLSENIL